tara:strand:+ start:514 stop:696 length:183 start_codon:yes stop_codon:yes gene_type:complete
MSSEEEKEFLEKIRVRVKSINLNESILQSKKESEIKLAIKNLLNKYIPEEKEEEDVDQES